MGEHWHTWDEAKWTFPWYIRWMAFWVWPELKYRRITEIPGCAECTAQVGGRR